MKAENNALGGSSGTQSFTVNGGSAGKFYNPPVHTLRIPSVEPYGYTEHPFSGTAEEAIAEQKRLTKIAKGEEMGIPPREYDEIIDEYIATQKIADGVERYNSLGTAKTYSQQDVIQLLKRSFKRRD